MDHEPGETTASSNEVTLNSSYGWDYVLKQAFIQEFRIHMICLVNPLSGQFRPQRRYTDSSRAMVTAPMDGFPLQLSSRMSWECTECDGLEGSCK